MMENHIFPGADDNYDYNTAIRDLPTEQSLFFCTNLSEASYLPTQYTTDEDIHITPNSWAQILFQGRRMQPAYMIQGRAGGYKFDINLLTQSADFENLSGYGGDGDILRNHLIYFEGTDASGAYFNSDEGFNLIRADEGIIGWQPEAVIAQSAGHFKSAKFVITNVNRDRTVATLDFDLNIIPNKEAFPYRYAVYITEFQRSLIMIHDLIETGRKQLAYYVALYTSIVKKKIDDMKAQMDAAKSQIDSTVKYGNDQINAMVTSGNKALDSFIADLTSKNQVNTNALAQLQKQITASDILTVSNAETLITQMFKDGKVDVTQTMNATTRAKLAAMNTEMEGVK